jgi:WD40 repeat protein
LVLIPHGNEVQVCDLQQGKVLMTLPHAAKVTAAQFSATENKVLTGDAGGEVRLWDIEGKAGTASKFQVASSKPALKGAIMAFNRTGTQAVVGTPQAIEAWKLDPARQSATPLGPQLGSQLEAVSDDGRHVLIGDSLYSWDPDAGLAKKGPTLEIKQPEKNRDDPLPAAFTNDGKWIATLALNQIQLYRTADGRAANFTAPQNRPPRSRDVVKVARGSSSHLYFSPDASLIASIFEEESIQIWSSRDKTQSRQSLSNRQPFTDVAFSPNSPTIATASYSGGVQIWDIRRAMRQNKPISLDSGLKENPGFSWKLSEDGRYVLLTNSAGERKVFESGTGKPVTAPAGAIFPKEPATGIENQTPEELEKKGLEEYSLLHPATGKPLTPEVMVTRESTVRWSRDGQRFLIVTPLRRGNELDKRLLTIRNATGTQLREPLVCYNAWFSPGGDAVLIATAYRGTVVMDIATGRDLAVLPNIASDSDEEAVWTSDGITILAGSYPGLKASLFHFDFWLTRAPALLADLAEGFAQLKIDEAGMPQSQTVLLPELCKLAESAAGQEGPQIFGAWAKAFAAARGTEPRASKK